MSEAILVQPAIALEAVLNEGLFSQTIKAVWSFAQWQHAFDVSEKEGLRCDVVPVSKMDADLETRGSIEWSPRTHIVIRRKFPPNMLSEADGKPINKAVAELVLLVEEVYAFLVAKRLEAEDGADAEAVWEKEEILAAYMPSHLRKHQFTGVILVTHSAITDLP